MSMPLAMGRRQFLGLAGGAAGALVLAACGANSSTPEPEFVASRLFDGRALVPDGTPQRLVWAVQKNNSYVTDEAFEVVRVEATQNGQVLFDEDVTVRREGLIVPYYPVVMRFPSSDPVDFTFSASGGSWASVALASGTGEEALVGPGDRFPSVGTPTFDNALGVDPMCTRSPEPCPFHEVSLDVAMATGRRVVLLLSTPAFCGNQIACGPALEILIDTVSALDPDVAVIHAEIYTSPTGRELGPTSPALDASGAWFEPLLYTIDADARVTHRLDFMFDRTELAEVLVSI